MAAKKVRLRFLIDPNDQMFQSICMIGVFEATCNSTPGIDESTWTIPSLNIDLLTADEYSIAAPTVTVVPPDCFTTSWAVN